MARKGKAPAGYWRQNGDTPNNTDSARAALSLAENGIPVFPVHLGKPDAEGKRGKYPAIPKEKGGNGHNDATIDAATVADWWQRFPRAVPGVPTGAASGLWALDIDPDGQEWAAEHGELLMAAGRIHHTGRGRHYLFGHVAGIKNSESKIAEGVDVRGEGGWIVWWPAAGLESLGDVEDVAPAPDALLALVRTAASRTERPAQAPAASGGVIPEGQRDSTLASLAGAMRRKGLTADEIEPALAAINRNRCRPPLADSDLARIAESVSRYAPGEAMPTAADWNRPVDLFAERPVPAFPAEIMPEPLRHCAEGMAEQTGFDAGGYLFTMLAHAGCLMDHRTRIEVNSNWREPPYHWAGLVDVSGGGKTPILNGAGQFAMGAYSKLVKDSGRAYAEWAEACQKAGKGEEPAKPTWQQRHTDDATIESMATLLVDNPQGVTVAIDELTGWLGRMDAYSSGGASKDRPAWLDAWSGRKDRAINRAKYAQPMIVPHWAAGVVGAIQPEMLVAQFKRGQGSSDGLLQRFMLYQLRPAGEPNLMANGDRLADAAAHNMFRALADMAADELPATYVLDTDAVARLQGYMGDLRIIQARMPGKRFGEHLGKFPGFVLRVALTLHVLHAVAGGRKPERAVAAETLEAAITLMRVLYRHSEAVYGVLDDTTGEPRALALSAAEAVLAKGWTRFNRGDLTRNATGWRAAERPDAEAAIDLLIELAWIRDVTEAQARGGRGRRSDGAFLVNPAVHERFAEHGERITEGRRERFEAIQRAAASRAGN